MTETPLQASYRWAKWGDRVHFPAVAIAIAALLADSMIGHLLEHRWLIALRLVEVAGIVALFASALMIKRAVTVLRHPIPEATVEPEPEAEPDRICPDGLPCSHECLDGFLCQRIIDGDCEDSADGCG